LRHGLLSPLGATRTAGPRSPEGGATADLAPVPVLGGARVVGGVGAWDVGLLDMHTERQGVSPAENFGVLRLRRPVLNPYSSAGMILTSYFGGGRHNFVLGGDGSFRVRGDDYLTVKMATSLDENEPDGVGIVDRSHFDARWERRTGRGLSYNLHLGRSGESYLPELAFRPRRDFTQANLLANWYHFKDDHPVLRRIWPGMLAFTTLRNADGSIESGQYAVWVQWETKTGGGGWIEPKLFRDSVITPFRIGNAIDIPAGDYTYADLQLALTMGDGARLRSNLDFRAGTYFDGTRVQAILTPTWNVSPHLELGADYQLSRLRFSTRNQKADIHVGRLRIRAALDARTSGNAFVQYNSTTSRLDFNVRLRHSFAEGTDLWLVYNEGLGTDRAEDPRGEIYPLSLSRALILKYSHTLGF
jgi:hypothetical protein